MSININSTQISALLQLYPMAIPGAVENLQPPGAYHLGIPESIHSPSTKLFMVIDPVTLFSTPFEAGDSVKLWVNSQATSVIKNIYPGEENDRIFMELPWGGLKNGLNTLYYEVTRVSGNKDKSDPILSVLFNNPASGITVSHPASIGPGQPARFTLTRSYPREYDVVTLTVGTWSKTIIYVHPANPITHTLTTTDLQQIGDGTHPVSATVDDQLSNHNVSPTTFIVITANTLVLPPPTVKGQTGNNFDSTLQNIEVLVPAGTLLPTDEIHAEWEGAISTPAASFISPKRLVSAGLTFVVPRSVLVYSLGKVVKVTYVIKRNGVTTSSQVLPLNILPLPATALIPPKILEANANNVLDVVALGIQNATIHALLWTLIADGMPCWLSLEGKKPDGTAHNLVLWNGLPARVNQTWVSQGFWPQALVNSFLKELGDGSSLIIKFAVSMDMSNVRATAVEFPDRPYTIKAVALVNATIAKVNENTATGALVANGKSTTATTLVISGTASAGQQVEVRNHNVLLGTVPVNAQGVFTYTHVAALLGARSYTAIGKYGSQVVSPAYLLTVVANVNATITKVNENTATGALVANGKSTTATTLVISGDAAVGQQVEVRNHNVLLGTVTADAQGKYSYTHVATVLGARSYTAKGLYGMQPVSAAYIVTVVKAAITIPVPDRPTGLVVSPDGKRLYVRGNAGTALSLMILGTDTWQLVGHIVQKAQYLSNHCAVSMDSRRFYFSDAGPTWNGLLARDAATLQLIAEVKHYAYSMALSPDGSQLWIRGASGLLMVDTSQYQLIRSVALPTMSLGSTYISGDGRLVFSISTGSVPGQSGTISVVDARSGAILNHIDVGYNPEMVVSPDSSRLYVFQQASQQLLVIDTKTYAITRPVTLGVPSGHLSISPDGKSVICASTAEGLVIDTATFAVKKIFAGDPFYQSAFSPDGSRLYLAMRHRKEIRDIPAP